MDKQLQIYQTPLDKLYGIINLFLLREAQRVTVDCDCGEKNKHNLELKVANGVNEEIFDCGSCRSKISLRYFYTNLFAR